MGRPVLNRSGGVAVAGLHDELTALAEQEVRVLLSGALEIGSTDEEAVRFAPLTRVEQERLGFEAIVAGRR